MEKNIKTWTFELLPEVSKLAGFFFIVEYILEIQSVNSLLLQRIQTHNNKM